MAAVASITLHRQAVTMPVYANDTDQPKSPAYAIVAEIAARLEELNEIKKGLGADLVTQLYCIACTSRRAYDITIQLLHGNMGEVLASYQDQADKRGVTKQDIHYEFTQEVAKLERLYPELHSVILAMRRQATQHEDPIGKNEVACPGGGE